MELGKDFYDCSAFGINASSCYECQQVGLDSNTLLFCNSVWLNMSNMHYCILNISNASNCFGCMGMRNGANHNVLNKPYSKHEYGVFCGKVVDHMVSTKEWGEFFPTELSPFGYNETMAQVFLPLERKEVLQR